MFNNLEAKLKIIACIFFFLEIIGSIVRVLKTRKENF